MNVGIKKETLQEIEDLREKQRLYRVEIDKIFQEKDEEHNRIYEKMNKVGGGDK